MTCKIASIAIAAIAIGPPRAARGGDSNAEQFQSEAEKLRLIEKAAANWKTVTRWRIEYQATPCPAPQTFIPVHKVMAVSPPGEFYELSAHFPNYPWQADPYCQEFFIHQGRTCHRWSFNRSYSEDSIKTGAVLPGTIPENVLLTVIPRWPLSAYNMLVDTRSDTPIIPVEALRSGNYRLLAHSESVGGEECAIFDCKGIDRIWIAREKGVCVMQREKRDPRSGRLVQRIVTDKVEEIAPGRWLPLEFRSQFFSSTQRTKKETVEWESKISILRCDLNDKVPESIFIPVHRPGSIKYDNENQFTQVSPGGEDLLDDMVNFMTKHAGLPTKPIPRNHSYVWLVGGLASGLFAGFFLFPMSKRRSMKAKVRDTPVSALGLNL